jgi:hypothetical protein
MIGAQTQTNQRDKIEKLVLSGSLLRQAVTRFSDRMRIVIFACTALASARNVYGSEEKRSKEGPRRAVTPLSPV